MDKIVLRLSSADMRFVPVDMTMMMKLKRRCGWKATDADGESYCEGSTSRGLEMPILRPNKEHSSTNEGGESSTCTRFGPAPPL